MTAPITWQIGARGTKHNQEFYYTYDLSAYEERNNLCLFERPFKIQKNGVFLTVWTFVIVKILAIL